MTQLTIRGFDEHLERYLLRLARNEGLSLNKAALKLMRRGAGLDTPADRRDVIGDGLDEFIGVWSKEEEQEFLDSIQIFEQIDESFWS